MARLRYNNCFGTIGATQNAGDATITFASALTYNDGQPLPSFGPPDTLDISVEPLTANFEIQRLTAYTQGSTVVSVVRGVQGVAKQHLINVPFGHDPDITEFDGETAPLHGAVEWMRSYCR